MLIRTLKLALADATYQSKTSGNCKAADSPTYENGQKKL
jgi:hypothetical protein